MTAPAGLAFPNSRTLAAWWRQLLPLQPQCLWIGHLFLHQVEALVQLTHALRLDPLDALVLKALALTSGTPLAALDDRLHLGRQVLGQMLRRLRTEGLTEPDAGGRWLLAPLGWQALNGSEVLRPRRERRIFYFLESPRPDRPPHFVNLHRPSSVPWSGREGWHFDIRLLQGCVGRPAEWKRQHGFPSEIQQVLGPDSAANNLVIQAVRGQREEVSPSTGPAVSDWRRVPLDRPERLVVALILQDSALDRLLAFAVRQDGWELRTEEPVLSLTTGWQELLPELLEEPPRDEWRKAWRAWCQPRGLVAADIDACTFEHDGPRLRVHAPARLAERLRAARSDAVRGEAWVLAGEGPIRAAAQIELVENAPATTY